MTLPSPTVLTRTIHKLGADLSLARRRRGLTQTSLAERIGASTMTVRRMEAGNPLVPLQYIARTLQVFGELGRLEQLLDAANDSIGLAIAAEQAPKRVRPPRRAPAGRPGKAAGDVPGAF